MKYLLSILIACAWLTAVGQEQQFTIVFLNKKPDADKLTPEETKTIMDGHMSNMERLAKENKLLAAGPFHGGGGLFIMNSGSSVEVEEWISTDPGVQAKRWRIEILPFYPRHGSVCPVGEEYKMVTYSFIRFDAVVSKVTAANYAQLMADHDRFLSEIVAAGTVVSQATFGQNAGGVVVINGEVDPDLFSEDPAVRSGLLEMEQKKLYIAEGSFCEK